MRRAHKARRHAGRRMDAERSRTDNGEIDTGTVPTPVPDRRSLSPLAIEAIGTGHEPVLARDSSIRSANPSFPAHSDGSVAASASRVRRASIQRLYGHSRSSSASETIPREDHVGLMRRESPRLDILAEPIFGLNNDVRQSVRRLVVVPCRRRESDQVGHGSLSPALALGSTTSRSGTRP